MIYCFRCNCGGSENLIRKALQRGGFKNWLTTPIPVGREAALRILQSFPQDNREIKSLIRYLNGASKFAIILGAKDGVIKWANLSDGLATSRLDAEVILDRLA